MAYYARTIYNKANSSIPIITSTHYITYNIDKSVILLIYYSSSRHNTIKLYIGNKLLNVVKAYTYRGHLIS